ncbi:hypothetical protein ACVWZM_004843 [Bradyrhizobium sp. USDA 4501]
MKTGLHLLVGIENNRTRPIVGEPGRQGQPQFAPCRLLTLPLVKTHPKLMQLRLAHDTGQSQQQAVVVGSRIVKPLTIRNEDAEHRAQFEKLMPVNTLHFGTSMPSRGRPPHHSNRNRSRRSSSRDSRLTTQLAKCQRSYRQNASSPGEIKLERWATSSRNPRATSYRYTRATSSESASLPAPTQTNRCRPWICCVRLGNAACQSVACRVPGVARFVQCWSCGVRGAAAFGWCVTWLRNCRGSLAHRCIGVASRSAARWMVG